MRIEIKTKNVQNKSRTERFVEHKVHSALVRLDSRIKTVVVRLDDNSKKPSEFIGNCRIEVDMNPRGHVHVAASGDSIFECVANAIRKMEHAVKHDIDRHRTSSKIRHQHNKQSFVEYVEEATSIEPATTE